ncbi:MAG: NAD-dependent epimerase/dehydratase family protein [Chloroflexi bacterium]|nr:NAD-dependent epimerase/dehydratase family protein [Chloroflexota bacterium]
MKYFVTGGAGFIGCHLVEALAQRGEVTVFDNLSTGHAEFLRSQVEKGVCHFVRGDTLDEAALTKAMQGHDMVFHLAAHTDTRFGDVDVNIRGNILGTRNVLQAMRTTGISRIVFTSSGTVYGEDPEVAPFPESYGPLHPISLYAATKLGCEGMLSAYSNLFDFQVWMFRFANIVGARMTHGVIFDFVRKLLWNPREMEVLGDGKQTKPYLLVQDCIRGVLLVTEQANGKVNLFNIGNDDAISVRDIARLVVQEMGLEGTALRFTGQDRGWQGDVPSYGYNVEKIRRLGWRPSGSSADAVREAARATAWEFSPRGFRKLEAV